MSNVDVVVTGLGATTPLGGDVASTWDAMLAGRSGVGRLTLEWAEQLTVKIGAQLKVDPSEVIVAKDIVHSGNTSAASVPLALSKLIETGQVPSGAPVLLFGFGGGLTYAGQVVRCP